MFIELVILDIDGVMTDGKKTYDLDGNVISKTYCDKDFTAIKRLKASGVKVCFLSGDNKVNEAMAANRNIDFYYARGVDKVEFVEKFEDIYSTTRDKMLYLGDDLFDMNIMKKVEYAYCTKDSPDIVRRLCAGFVLDRVGGENVIAALVDELLDRGLINDSTLEEIEKLDKLEIF
tara:strand:- start:827 stop:1351 length:525 start_codon:yes stop_codon:yes gene_type:complete